MMPAEFSVVRDANSLLLSVDYVFLFSKISMANAYGAKFSHVIVRFKRVYYFACCRMIMKCGLAVLRNYLSFSQPLSSSTFSRNTVFTLSQSARFLLFIFYVVFSLNKVLT